jgi:tetratricopeptide (TPR) repeat protein
MAELSPRIAELSARLQKEPGSRLFVPLAEEYVKAEMLEEAVQVLIEGLKKHPDFFSAHVVLGQAYFEQRKFKEAKVELEQVLKANPDNLLALRKLSVIYRMEGERDKAKRCCEQLLAANPKDAEARTLLEELAAAASKEEATSIPISDAPLESQLLSPTPSSSAPTAPQPVQARDEDEASEEELVSPTLAQLYLEQGHYAQAVRVYDELLRRDPHNGTYQQARKMALALQEGESSQAAPSPSAQPEEPAASIADLTPERSPDQPPDRPHDRAIQRLHSWLLRIQQQRRRRAS